MILLAVWISLAQGAGATLPCLPEWKTGKFGKWAPAFAAECVDSSREDWAAMITQVQQQIRELRDALAGMPNSPEFRELRVDGRTALEAFEDALQLARRELARSAALKAGKPDPEAPPPRPPASAPPVSQSPGTTPGTAIVSPAGVYEPHFKPLQLSPIQQQYVREGKIQETELLLKEDDAETERFLAQARRSCESRGTATTACMPAYANQHRADVPDRYLSRRNAEHYLFAKSVCENPSGLLNAGTMTFFIPMYSLAKATNVYWERLFPDAVTRFPEIGTMLRWLDERMAKPPGSLEAILQGRAWDGSMGTLRESYWGYRGLLHCNQ